MPTRWPAGRPIDDHADGLVAQVDRRAGVEGVALTAADRRGLDPHQHLAGRGSGDVDLRQFDLAAPQETQRPVRHRHGKPSPSSGYLVDLAYR